MKTLFNNIILTMLVDILNSKMKNKKSQPFDTTLIIFNFFCCKITYKSTISTYFKMFKNNNKNWAKH